MSDTPNISALAQQMRKVAATNLSDLPLGERHDLLTACAELRASAETVLETGTRLIFGATEPTMLRLAVDMGIFDVTARHDEAMHVDSIAKELDADPLLVLRIMRLLASSHVFEETGPSYFKVGSFGKAMVKGSPFREAAIHCTSTIRMLGQLPWYFKERGWKNPSDANDGPFQYTLRTDKHYFDWIQSEPEENHAFNMAMTMKSKGRGEDWYEFWPTDDKLAGVKPDEPLIVDVGGGLGHDLVSLLQAHPKLEGRAIVQDLPQIVKDAKDLPPRVEAQAHNFFSPQPVKGARAYYLHSVLHDWPDRQAKEILAPIHDAMDHESVLLIHENILPDEKVLLFQAQMDLQMMVEFAALERTKDQFARLLDESGFELVQVWQPSEMIEGSGTLFEARKIS